jgi:hypothetical protein
MIRLSDLANCPTILSSGILVAVGLLEEMRSKLCSLEPHIVVRKWLLTSRSLEKALSVHDDVTGSVSATSVI